MADDKKDDGFDLSQFYEIFFEEAGENLQQMEQQLLELDLDTVDDEQLNAIFRCAHSIKGGAATFGFADVAELTHQMESLLDKLRRHELQLLMPMVDVLLESSDALKGLLARHQGSGNPAPETSELVQRIRHFAAGGAAPSAPQAAAAAPSVQAASPAPAPAPVSTGTGQRVIVATIGPLDDMAMANNIKDLFKDIEGLGTITAESESQGSKVFTIDTSSSDDDLLDLFTFHVARDKIQLQRADARPQPAVAPPVPTHEEGYGLFAGAPGSPIDAEDHSTPGQVLVNDDFIQGYGLFEGAPGFPAKGQNNEAMLAQLALDVHSATDTPAQASSAQTHKAAVKAANQASTAHIEATSLRVSVSKIDQLINQVGELVITQAMLAQNSRELDPTLHQALLAGLSDLERNTRDLQESVMSIRMIPMSVVFSRFPRMLRDLSGKLGKKVELITHGEATELDKGLIEKITDPLTHLIRNSCDHGIEMPEQRLAAGKPEMGTINLSAAHQGGSILIEVRDDGKGLSRQKLLDKARSKGIDCDDNMSDQDVWGLIFAPGFSTAEVVTDVSGRGVGMDVVKKNIASLGGTVEIDSSEGFGMSVKVRLPLTLAIMDGMSVRVGREVYILPLASVVESFQAKDSEINSVANGSKLVKVRDAYMPVIALDHVFDVPRDTPQAQVAANAIMVVIESDGSQVALVVDELLGQQQVVIKNLEANYKKVPNISGATILGDGRVALILDTSSLARRSRY